MDKELASLINQIVLVIVLSVTISGLTIMLNIFLERKDKAIENFEIKEEMKTEQDWTQYTHEVLYGSELLTISSKLVADNKTVVIMRNGTNTMLGPIIGDASITSENYYTAAYSDIVPANTTYLADNTRALRDKSNSSYINLKHKYRSYPIRSSLEINRIIGIAFVLQY